MAIKELKTRIALKYDSYSAWTTAPGKDLVLLAGELGICYIGDANQGSNVVPTVLFKVGDGTKTFENLPWASAKAADVYSWAKASDVVYNQTAKTITFVKGNTDGSDKVITFNYVTLAEVEEITNQISADLAALTTRVGDAETNITNITKATDGIIDTRIAAAEGRAATDAQDKADFAQAEAERHADDLNTAMDERVANLETSASTFEADIAENAQAIADEVAAREAAIGEASTADKDATGIHAVIEAADNAIYEKIGDVGEGTVAAAIEAAKDAAIGDATGKVNALTDRVSTNEADIAQLKTDLATETSERKSADEALDNRLKEVEAFFEGAKEDSEGLNDALDKLVDIQNYLSGDGSAAGDLVGQVSANAQAITALQDIVKDGGTLEIRVDAVEASTSANAADIKTLQDLVSDYEGAGAIKTAIEAAAAKGQQGIDDAKKAQDAADKAQGEVDALEGVVSTLRGEYDVTKALATTNEAAIAAIDSRVGVVEGVVNGDDSNAKLRAAITDLQTLTGDSAKGNAALYTEIARVAGLVDNTTTGLAATKAIADEAKSDAEDAQARVAAIEADYIKSVDELIFNCGTATTVVHVKPTEQN